MRRSVQSSVPSVAVIRHRACLSLRHGLSVILFAGLTGCLSPAQKAEVKSVLHSATADLQTAITLYQNNQGPIEDVVNAAQKLAVQTGVGAQAVQDVQAAVVSLQLHAGTVEQVQAALSKVAAVTVPATATSTAPASQ